MSEIRGKKHKTETGEVRRWEDMMHDCLIKILGGVGLRSLLLDVPFVCKSWHEASLTPSLWKRINCSEFTDYPSRTILNRNRVNYFSGLMKLMVSLGQGMTTALVLPSLWREKDMEYVAEKCPELKELSLEFYIIEDGDFSLLKFIPKWKKLELLSLCGHSGVLPNIAAQIEKNCENFNSLVVKFSRLGNEDSSAIAKHLPKIKSLSLNYCAAEDLTIIVLGCEELEFLRVDNCEYGDDWNEEKLKELTSHIKTVMVYPYDTCSEDDDPYSEDDDPYSDDDDRLAYELIDVRLWDVIFHNM